MYFLFQKFRLIWGLLLLLTPITWAATSYQLSDAHLYQVRYQCEIINTGGVASEVRCQFPLIQTDDLPPYQKLISISASNSLKKVVINDQEKLELFLNRLVKNQPVQIEITYLILNYAIQYPLKPISQSFRIEARYLEPEPGVESDSEPIRYLARVLTDGENYALDKAKRIYEYVSQKLTYKIITEQDHSALRTLNRGYGSCMDYSMLFTALCRAVQIPARLVSGFRFDPIKLNEKFSDLEQYGHMWVEVYLPGIGWVSVDPTYIYQENGVSKVNFEYFGKIPAEDRHLFSGYQNQENYRSTWKYEPKSPPKIEFKPQTLIRRLRN